MLKFIGTYACIFFLSFYQLGAQSIAKIKSSERYSVGKISQDNGLSHNNIFAITQDNDGFIWFGTEDGLNRYDGYDFVVYRNLIDDPSSLSDNFMHAILSDSKGNIWIGTSNGGVNWLDKSTNSFRRFTVGGGLNTISNNACHSLIEDRNGNIWAGTENGLNRISTNDHSVTPFLVDSPNNTDYHQNSMLSLFIDKSDRLWVCMRGGVFYIDDFYTKEKANSITFDDAIYVSNLEFWSIYQDKNNIIWLAGIDGIFTYNNETKSLNGFLLDNKSYSIIEDSDSTLWASYGSDLCKINIKDKTCIKQNEIEEHNAGGNQIRCMYKDHSGVLWLGIRGTGLTLVNKQKKFEFYGFNSNDKNSLGSSTVRAITSDNEGNVWLSSSNFGLNKINSNTGNITRYGYPEFPADHALALHCDDAGAIWAGVRMSDKIGLIKYNPSAKKYKTFSGSKVEETGVKDMLVREIYEDSQGMYWLGLEYGVEVFNPNTEQFIAYYTYQPSDDGLASASVQSGSIVEDNEGNMWIGSWGGLTKVKFDKNRNYKKPIFKQFYHNPYSPGNTLSDNRIVALHVTSGNEIWIGTYGGGLNRYNPKDSSFTHFTVLDGLANNVVHGILEDKKGNLWVSTNYGLSNYLKETQEFRNYYEFDGLQHNQFNWGSCYNDSNGKLYFGGIGGLTAFYPEKIIYDSVAPKVVFTELTVLNKKVNVGEEINGNIILKSNLNHADEITLTHREKIFSIGLSVLHFVKPENNVFSYKLEGFDDEWTNVESTRRFVTYTNLPSGEYTFLIRGANYNGVWTQHNRQLKIIVLPPYWESWWFRLLTISLIVILVVVAYRLRIHNLKMQKKDLEVLVNKRTKQLKNKNEELEQHHERLERLVDERTKDLVIAKNKAEKSDQLKTAFLANMSHEIRTPLNAIVGFSSLLTSDDMEDDKKTEFSEAIINSTDDLLHLVDDIIDLSRIESDDLKVSLKSCNLNRLLIDITPVIESLLYRYKKADLIEYKVHTSQENIHCITDESRIKQVLINLISNAIKFTDSGVIEFGYHLKPSKKEHEDYEILLYVKDSGVGISPDIVNSIFDRFTKAHESSTKLYRGAGLGLAISRSVVNMLGGRIWVESTVGEGATFNFTIPHQPAVIIDNNSSQQPKSKENILSSLNWKDRIILVAEDEDSNFDYLEAALTNTKVKIVRALNGVEAVNIFNSQKFDLILMDMRMPEMDGYEATKKIKQTEPHIPVIALTAYGMSDDKNKCINAGCDAYISKPFKPDDLVTINKFFIAASG